MAPALGTAVPRWSDEEHDILMQVTCDQLELEKKDESQTIPWAAHWTRVSLRLQEHGYNRTPNACGGYWKRGRASQMANEQAAGPTWNDTEHQLLIGMTEDQLELERVDQSSVITWPRHWEIVSLQLQDNGYHRSAEACAAYWILAQNETASPHGSVNRSHAENQSRETDIEIGDECYAAVAAGHATNLQSVDGHQWTNEEFEILLRAVKLCRGVEGRGSVDESYGIKQWMTIAQVHQKYGFHRDWEACKTYWEKCGKFQNGLKEHPNSTSSRSIDTTLSESKPSSVSSVWSPMNELEDVIVVSESTASDNLAEKIMQKGQSEFGIRLEVYQNQTSSSDSLISETTSSSAHVSDSRTSEFNAYQLQGEQETCAGLPPSGKPVGSPEIISSSKTKEKGFRFKPHQRAFLETEAAKNGSWPDTDRREEVAVMLGVEEKTVKNWFCQYRKRKNSQVNPNSPLESVFNSNSGGNSASAKRTYANFDLEQEKDVADVSSKDISGERAASHFLQPAKKLRLGNMTGQATIATANSTNAEPQAPPKEQPELPPSGSQISLKDVLPKETGHGGRHYKSRDTAGRMSQSPIASSTSAPDANSPSPLTVTFENSSEFLGSPARQLPSDPTPGIVIAPRQPTANMTNESVISTAPSSNETPVTRNDASWSNIKISDQVKNNDPKIPEAVGIQSTSISAEEQSRLWAARQVQNFQFEIQRLKDDTAAHEKTLTTLETMIKSLHAARSDYGQSKEQEIAHFLEEIEERYNRKNEVLNAKMESHSQLKQLEINNLKKNSLEVSRKENGLRRFQAIVDYYEAEGDE